MIHHVIHMEWSCDPLWSGHVMYHFSDERHARPGKKPKTDEQGEEIPEEEEDLNESNYDEVMMRVVRVMGGG